MIITTVELSDGTLWHAGSGLCSPNDIIINAADISEMTNAAIVANVREMIWHARRAHALSIADQLNFDPKRMLNGINHVMGSGADGADEAIQLLREFASTDKRIADTVYTFELQEVTLRYQRSPSKVLRRKILERDSSICRYCGCDCKGYEHVDHVIPYSQGGRTIESNLVCACAPCNRKKHARSLADAGMVLREVPSAMA